MGRRARRRPPAEPPKRERLGRERPGAVLHGPPITIACECGEKHAVPYGEQWECETCGREWDTRQIPAEDYAAIRKTQLRYRLLPIVLGLLVVVAAAFFTLTGNVFSVFFLLPIALTGWFAILRPAHRKRYRAAVADLPRWQLRAK